MMKIADAIILALLISGCLDEKPVSETTAIALPIDGVYKITSGEASYAINEVLYSEPKTVIGKTQNIAGDIFLDSKNASKTRIGAMRVNARSFSTDNERRDSAVRRFVMLSEKDEYEFIEFSPTSIDGLPQTLENHITYEFGIKGDLTIKGVTKTAVFSAKLMINGTSMEGNAGSKIERGDFGLQIPNIPFVASVGNDVLLSVSFKAVR